MILFILLFNLTYTINLATDFYQKIIEYSDLYYDENKTNEAKINSALQLLDELKNVTPPNFQEEELYQDLLLIECRVQAPIHKLPFLFPLLL